MSYIKLFKNCLTWKKTELGSVYSINVDAPFKKKKKKEKRTARHKISQHD